MFTVPFHLVKNAPSTLYLRKHSSFRHLYCIYHTCSKTGWRMTHLTSWPQFMCSLCRFTRKKDIFRSNKRLRHCNPTIVSFSLEFSMYCFKETARSAPDWHLQSADSKSPACFNLPCQNKAQTLWVTKGRAPPSPSGPNWWCLSFRPTGQHHRMLRLFKQTRGAAFLIVLHGGTDLATSNMQIIKYKWQDRDWTCVKTHTFSALCKLNCKFEDKHRKPHGHF